MSKHKTRQQKIIAQLHRKLEMQQDLSGPKTTTQKTFTYTLPTPHVHTSFQKTIALPYLKQDLLKTIFVTSGIIVAQLLLYYSLKTHMINLPIGRY